MALVTTKELMLDAQKNHYAIGAFNAENMEMVQAIIAAAEELRAPVIVQTTPGTLKYASPAMFHAMVAAAASEATVPVVMHLDHGSSYELAMKAFRAGYTSVMIDGSHHVFEENIEITKEVVRACHAAGLLIGPCVLALNCRLERRATRQIGQNHNAIAGAELIECGVELLRQLLRRHTLFKVDVADVLVLASDHLSGSVDAISKMAVAGNYQTDHVRCPPDFFNYFSVYGYRVTPLTTRFTSPVGQGLSGVMPRDRDFIRAMV